MRLLLRWVISALAIFVAVQVVPGLEVDASDSSALVLYALMAVLLGLANAFIRPLLVLLTCPLQMMTLGLFALVTNAVTFWLAGWAARTWLDVPFHVEGFLAALLGSIVVSVVSTLLGLFVRD